MLLACTVFITFSGASKGEEGCSHYIRPGRVRFWKTRVPEENITRDPFTDWAVNVEKHDCVRSTELNFVDNLFCERYLLKK